MHIRYSRFTTATPSEYSEPNLLPVDRSKMARILARLALLLIGTGATAPHASSTQCGLPMKKRESPSADHGETCR